MTVTDQTGRSITIDFIPKRIVSVVPSQTELLYDLGLDEEVIGITKFCIHPNNWFRTKTRVGGTKKLNFEAIEKLQPDLIIANKEENTKEEIEELCKKYNVWISDIKTVDDALQMILCIGQITHTNDKASSIINTIKANFNNHRNSQTFRSLYFIWYKPYMLAGADTFINEMMTLAGFENVCKQLRYPEINTEEILKLNPQVILLSSEPFPFKQKHIEELKQHLPQCKIHIVDGEMFSWYGSRMLKAIEYFRNLKNEITLE